MTPTRGSPTNIRTIQRDLDWLTRLLERMGTRRPARLELSVDGGDVIVQLMADHIPKPLVGRGDTPTKAIRDLRDEIVRFAEQ